VTHALLAAVAQGPATPRELAARAVCGVQIARERCCYLARIGVLERVGRGPLRQGRRGKAPHVFALAAPGRQSPEEQRRQALAHLGAAMQGWGSG